MLINIIGYNSDMLTIIILPRLIPTQGMWARSNWGCGDIINMTQIELATLNLQVIVSLKQKKPSDNKIKLQVIVMLIFNHYNKTMA